MAHRAERLSSIPGDWWVVVDEERCIWVNETKNINDGIGICIGPLEDVKRVVEIAERLLLPEHRLGEA